MIVTSRTEAAMTRPRVTRAATAKVAADRIKADRTTTVRKTTNRVTEDGKAGYIVVDGSLRDELQHRCITYSVTVAKTTTLTVSHNPRSHPQSCKDLPSSCSTSVQPQ